MEETPNFKSEFSRTFEIFDDRRHSSPFELTPVQQSLMDKLERLDSQVESFKRHKFREYPLPHKRSRTFKPRRLKKRSIPSPQPQAIPKVKISNNIQSSVSPVFKVLASPQNNRLGPGTYNALKTETVEGGFMSRVSRFPEDLSKRLEKYFPVRDKEIEKRNKDLERFYPENKRKIIDEKSRTNFIRTEIQRKAKELMDLHYQKEQEKKYMKKMLKIEWLTKGPEVFKVKKAWGVLAILYTLPVVLIERIKFRKIIVERNKRFRSLFYYTMTYIGKLARSLKNIRMRKLAFIMMRISPRIIRWVKRRRQKYLDIIDDVIERPTDFTKLFKLMVTYKTRIVKCQRLARNFIAIKRARKKVLYTILTQFVIKKRISDKMVDSVYALYIKKYLAQGSLNFFTDKKIIQLYLRSRRSRK